MVFLKKASFLTLLDQKQINIYISHMVKKVIDTCSNAVMDKCFPNRSRLSLSSWLCKFGTKRLSDDVISKVVTFKYVLQKQQPRGVPRKRCSENMQQIYNRTPMPKYDFNKIAKQLY